MLMNVNKNSGKDAMSAETDGSELKHCEEIGCCRSRGHSPPSEQPFFASLGIRTNIL